MKCIVKKIYSLILVFILLLCIVGCKEEIVLEEKYDLYQTTKDYGIGVEQQTKDISFFAESLCVGGNQNVEASDITKGSSKASGLFQLKEGEIEYAKGIHERLYPASTTKVLTAYVALKHGNLEDVATVSEEALELEAGSTLCGVSAGDKISLQELLYGLMLCSGNDAANVIAELVSGSTEEFAKLMNQEAKALGATNSNFVNPHGLHDDQHYTTVYDMYLILQKAVQDDLFCQLIQTKNHQAHFTNSKGEDITKDWTSTNRYLKGEEEIPEGIAVLGGKTGTTNDAGYCLVLYCEDKNHTPYISIVMKADSRDNLYIEMSEFLRKVSR